jgi:hypothetical protein
MNSSFVDFIRFLENVFGAEFNAETAAFASVFQKVHFAYWGFDFVSV